MLISIMFLFALLFAGFITAVIAYVLQNGETQPVSLLQWQWSSLPQWLPVLVASGGMFLLMLLYHSVVGMRSNLRQWGVRRRLYDRETTAAELRGENERLRSENEGIRARISAAPRERPPGSPVSATRGLRNASAR